MDDRHPVAHPLDLAQLMGVQDDLWSPRSRRARMVAQLVAAQRVEGR